MIIFILIPMLNSQSVDIFFQQGNNAYAEGKYQEAVDLYLKVLNEGYTSGEVYFNLGNAYYKLDEIGRAILYYEKATHYLEGDEALARNLSIAELRVVDEIEPIPKIFLEEWWDWLIHIFSINTFAWLCLALFILISLFSALYINFAKINFKRLLWISAVGFILVVSLFIGRIYQFESSQYGIILSPKVSVVSEPSLTGTEVFIIHEGTKVKINRSLDGWMEISLADGKTGWLKSDELERI
jgi:tetratricopeptide (TPR) repeat protein